MIVLRCETHTLTYTYSFNQLNTDGARGDNYGDRLYRIKQQQQEHSPHSTHTHILQTASLNFEVHVVDGNPCDAAQVMLRSRK
jgi:hypothetical protein